MHIKNNLIIMFFLFCLLFAGCFRLAIPPAPTLKLSGFDTSPLKGKTIVIDPGHGGQELGAVGLNGLKESEVNLGVALYLWGLLKSAGAFPVLTRSSDTTVLTDQDFILKKDLQARSELSNNYGTDLFISIHHNSAVNNRKRNDLSIFFKISDPGPSRDIANEICKALQKKLQAEKADIHPGNYTVLRNTNAPAILGEASFMTNRKNEGMLSFHRQLSTEAEGYFTGILNYFRKGIPDIAFSYPENTILTDPQPQITAHIYPGTDNTSIDTSSVKVTLDHKAVTKFSFQEEGFISFSPRFPLQNGIHRYCVSARNRAGNSSGKTCLSFTVSLPPDHIEVSPVFPVIPSGEMSGTPVDILVMDSMNRPVIDGTVLKLSSTGGSFLQPVRQTKNGKARAILISDKKAHKVTVTVTSGNAVSHCEVKFGPPKEALLMATIRDSFGNPVEDAKLVRNNRTVDLSDSNGFAYDSTDAANAASYKLLKRGYQPLFFSPTLSRGSLSIENLLLEPVDDGVFFNRTIILDPARSSVESLPVITELKKRIENAGGTVILTWKKPPAPSAQERVVMAGQEKADLFFTVEIAGKGVSAGYYFKSTQGETLAALLCKNLMEIKKRCKIFTSTRYVIIHTSMPAVWLSLPESTIQAVDGIYKSLVELFLNSGDTILNY